MYEFYQIKIEKWGVDILVKTKNDRIVDPTAVGLIEKTFPDFKHRFLGSPFSEFKSFILSQYRTAGAAVIEVAKPGGDYAQR